MSPGEPIRALLLSLLIGCSGVSPDPNSTDLDASNLDPNAPSASALCPAQAGGIAIGPDKRFFFGMNYACADLAAAFGGISGWNHDGVSGRASEHGQHLALMRKSGAGVLRWWLIPDFRGDVVVFDPNDKPTGLDGTFVDDVDEALRLAEEADTYLMPCLWSFRCVFPDARR